MPFPSCHTWLRWHKGEILWHNFTFWENYSQHFGKIIKVTFSNRPHSGDHRILLLWRPIELPKKKAGCIFQFQNRRWILQKSAQPNTAFKVKYVCENMVQMYRCPLLGFCNVIHHLLYACAHTERALIMDTCLWGRIRRDRIRQVGVSQKNTSEIQPLLPPTSVIIHFSFCIIPLRMVRW